MTSPVIVAMRSPLLRNRCADWGCTHTSLPLPQHCFQTGCVVSPTAESSLRTWAVCLIAPGLCFREALIACSFGVSWCLPSTEDLVLPWPQGKVCERLSWVEAGPPSPGALKQWSEGRELAWGHGANLTALLFPFCKSPLVSHCLDPTPPRQRKWFLSLATKQLCEIQVHLDPRAQWQGDRGQVDPKYSCTVGLQEALRETCMQAQLCQTLGDPMDYSPPSSSVHRIFQTRKLE